MNYSLKSNALKSSCPKATALSAAPRYLGARGKIVTTISWAKLSPQNIPHCKQEVPWVCKSLPLPKKQQVPLQAPSPASQEAFQTLIPILWTARSCHPMVLRDPWAAANDGFRLGVFEKITRGCRSVYGANASFSLEEINKSGGLCLSDVWGTTGSI